MSLPSFHLIYDKCFKLFLVHTCRENQTINNFSLNYQCHFDHSLRTVSISVMFYVNAFEI